MDWETPAEGWFRDTLQGKPAFSDGHAMFIGAPPHRGAKRPLRDPKKNFDWALGNASTQQMNQLHVVRNDFPWEFGDPKLGKDESMPCVVFSNGTWIQAVYHKHARKFKGIKFYEGQKINKDTAHIIICKVKEQVIGAIMPIRTPKPAAS
jgi:hypothetical protein